MNLVIIGVHLPMFKNKRSEILKLGEPVNVYGFIKVKLNNNFLLLLRYLLPINFPLAKVSFVIGINQKKADIIFYTWGEFSELYKYIDSCFFFNGIYEQISL